jgi:cystathionine beta-synthase
LVVRTEELVFTQSKECVNTKISNLCHDITGFVGSVDESDLFQSYVSDKDVAEKP